MPEQGRCFNMRIEEGNSVWLVAMEEKLVAAARNPTNVKGEQKE